MNPVKSTVFYKKLFNMNKFNLNQLKPGDLFKVINGNTQLSFWNKRKDPHANHIVYVLEDQIVMLIDIDHHSTYTNLIFLHQQELIYNSYQNYLDPEFDGTCVYSMSFEKLD